MSDISKTLSDFPSATVTEWRALVEKTLKGAPFESLQRTTLEGLPIAPLYDGETAAPSFVPRPHDAERPWDIRTIVAHPDLARANVELLADLEGGAASALLVIDPTGEQGVAIGSAEELSRALDGVMLEFAPVALDAGFLGPKAADWLAAAAKNSPTALLSFHLDPLSAFARAGASPGPIESHVVSAATVGARLIATYPKAGLFLASGRVVHEAGGGEAGELAFMLASALTYAKALVRAGLPMAEAFAAIHLGLSADADYFATLAKHRAARLLWTRLVTACGVEAPARIEARSSHRMLAAQDPWTNMLRLTSAAFGAAVGGADAVVLGAFTDALGLPTEFARRQSRNAQLVLMEEAHLGRVSDPAAGSGYVEALTDEMARAAWAQFQAIETAGGLIATLASGHVAAQVAVVVAARDAAGPPKIVGVTAFPPTQDAPVEVQQPAPRTVDAPSTRLPGPDGHCLPLTPVRLAEPHEAAR
ncbi:methylmalonyl-CoA mutase family protein [Phenylobacterium sp. Root700]|uniref:methylmalonyl-CoA mutase family protein n=1 Tax=Phenylobacterium sp. Root700 TaxID=1736591 RepID=UPI0006FE8118|nr:methylmalonyl-CoA mutase family protein [Phenylobacterium sp. Root700]KRB52516.1 methylmalonyl-CoA mutase [Phenylobacterium sp. Root700]